MLNLVAQAEQIGHISSTLSNSVLDNYHHLGDAASITDGLHYDPSLKPYEISADGKRSGTPDDMWAFTTRNPRLDLQAAGVFTSAARVLKGYNDELANRAQKQADRLRKEATALQRGSRFRRDRQAEADDDWLTGLGNVARNLQTALDSIPMKDEAYKQKLRPAVEKYNEYIHSFDKQNPYGVPIGLGNWAGVNAVLNFGITVNYGSSERTYGELLELIETCALCFEFEILLCKLVPDLAYGVTCGSSCNLCRCIVCLKDHVLIVLVDVSFVAGAEYSSALYCLGTEHECRCHTSAVSDTACCNDRDIYRVNDLGNKCHRGRFADMSA